MTSLFMEFIYSEEKNAQLSELRGVSFEDVIEAIAERGVLAVYEHPNQHRYPGQLIMVVNLNDYPHCVPFSVEGEAFYLKTVYPSRRFRRLMEGE